MTRSEGNRLWTEGPWMAAASPSSVVGWPVVRQGVGRSICSVSYLPKEVDAQVYAESEANANLIAAAPRLYETLDVLLNCLDREAVARLGIEQEVLAAVCALQQARGETND